MCLIWDRVKCQHHDYRLLTNYAWDGRHEAIKIMCLLLSTHFPVLCHEEYAVCVAWVRERDAWWVLVGNREIVRTTPHSVISSYYSKRWRSPLNEVFASEKRKWIGQHEYFITAKYTACTYFTKDDNINTAIEWLCHTRRVVVAEHAIAFVSKWHPTNERVNYWCDNSILFYIGCVYVPEYIFYLVYAHFSRIAMSQVTFAPNKTKK